MKKSSLLFFLVLLMLCVALSHALAEDKSAEGTVFNLPASLRIIEDSAFENTMPTEIRLPGSMEYIGDRAFAGAWELSKVYIPKSVTYIGEEAFPGPENVLIVGVHGSFAEAWAMRHGYRFVNMDIWAEDGAERVRSIRQPERLPLRVQPQPGSMASVMILLFSLFVVVFNPNPKDRPEYYPIEYDFP